jgi:hypothetical protein
MRSLLAGVFVVCGLATFPSDPAAQDTASADAVKSAVIGDGGTGLRPQYEIAARMAAARATFPFDLVLMPGDNFYGRQGPEDLKQKFVEVTDAELRFRTISRGGATVDAGVIRRRTRRGESAATSEDSGARAGATTLIGTSRGVR